jgi:hypothetical protein
MPEEFLDSKIILCNSVHDTTPPERVIVSLKSGQTIFEDKIKGLPHFWKRLREYVHSSKDKITGVRYQHNKGIENLPSNMPYYYYIIRQFGDFGVSAMQTFRLGYSEGEEIKGIEVGYGRIDRFAIDLSRGGFGLISNLGSLPF